MACENCGSNNVTEKEIEGYLVAECQVCGHMHGDRTGIDKINDVREAREKSIDPMVYSLYKTMDNIPTFKMQFATPGYPQERMHPYLSFRLSQDSLKQLETFVEAVVAATKQTKIHWIVEASFQKELIFTLKPNFHHDPYNISAEQISLAQKDLAILNEVVSRYF